MWITRLNRYPIRARTKPFITLRSKSSRWQTVPEVWSGSSPPRFAGEPAAPSTAVNRPPPLTAFTPCNPHMTETNGCSSHSLSLLQHHARSRSEAPSRINAVSVIPWRGWTIWCGSVPPAPSPASAVYFRGSPLTRSGLRKPLYEMDSLWFAGKGEAWISGNASEASSFGPSYGLFVLTSWRRRWLARWAHSLRSVTSKCLSGHGSGALLSWTGTKQPAACILQRHNGQRLLTASLHLTATSVLALVAQGQYGKDSRLWFDSLEERMGQWLSARTEWAQ